MACCGKHKGGGDSSVRVPPIYPATGCELCAEKHLSTAYALAGEAGYVAINRQRIIGVSIHAPRAGRDCDGENGGMVRQVSIHAPRAGRDDGDLRQRSGAVVSIHAPRAGRDTRRRATSARRSGFNPRAPRGARLRAECRTLAPTMFQSTRPARGATGCCLQWDWLGVFQSTRPARGATENRVVP